jgi:hypothetical protein|tara:strand:+ start:459 stop:878 length:420 start_codon:yes stop_codon:yes gene_type:complete
MPIKITRAAELGRPNTRRMNRLEELGRVDSERAHTGKGKRNLREEKKRIVGELRDRYKKGGRAKPWGHGPKPGSLEYFQHTTQSGKPTRSKRAGGGVIKGAIKGAKTVVAPFTHAANAMRAGATKLIKGKPKIAKKGWK